MVTPEQLANARRDLGQQLAARREAAGLTQAQLARLTGYTRSAVANVETGRSNQPRACWVRYDQLLGAEGVLLASYDYCASLTAQRRQQAARERERQRTAKIEQWSRTHTNPGTDGAPSGPVTADEALAGSDPALAPSGALGDPGAVVQTYRAALGLSHRDLADLLRIPTSRLVEIEAGRRAVQDLDLLAELATRLSIPPDDLGMSDDLHRLAVARGTRPPAAPDDLLQDGQPSVSMRVEAVEASQRRWRDVRRYLNRHRPELGRAAVSLYPDGVRIGRTPLIAGEGWLPDHPVDLERVELQWRAGIAPTRLHGDEPQARSVLPLRAPGGAYDRYTSAVRYIEPPALFENRPSYRLLDMSWRTEAGRMTFGIATYFDKLDICEALGHEYAAAAMALREPEAIPSMPQLPFRAIAGDPFGLTTRAVVPAVTTLTILVRHGQPAFLLHWRDPAKVATAGGMYDVIPAGEFQPSSVAVWDQDNDLDLWRNIVRELSEELLGAPEHDGSRSTPIDYDRWPLYRALQTARADGRLTAVCLGAGLDALTLAATIMTVVVIDATVFDDIFGQMVTVNAEGLTITGDRTHTTAATGIPFTDDTVTTLLERGRLASPGAACLHLAWTHRAELLQAHTSGADTLGAVTDPSSAPTDSHGKASSPTVWQETRSYLRQRRGELTRDVATFYPDNPCVDGTVLLTRPTWIPTAPILLQATTLHLTTGPPRPTAVSVTDDPARQLLPTLDGDRAAASYAQAVAAIERPSLLEDRPTYRLVTADLTDPSPSMSFGIGTYFDVLNIGEAAAHEYAWHRRVSRRPDLSQLPLRLQVGDPTDLTRRPALTAITTLTIRNDTNGVPRFLVHWRDPAKVATNADMYQLTPVGMFQPAGPPPDRSVVDLDLWRCMAREYSEELLGEPEHEAPAYETWPFFLDLETARRSGTCRPYLLGIGVDPLTYATDLLTVTVFEPAAFDSMFADLVTVNAEGELVGEHPGGLLGTPFTETEVHRLASLPGMQQAGAATLHLAWRHRGILLATPG